MVIIKKAKIILHRYLVLCVMIARGRIRPDWRALPAYLWGGFLSVALFVRGRHPLLSRPSIALGLSLRCNNTCAFCLAHSPLIQEKKERAGGRTWQVMTPDSTEADMLSFDRLREIVDDLVVMRPDCIDLSGHGETLLSPHLIPVIEYIRSTKELRAVPLKLTTNGILLSRTMAEALCAAGIDSVTVSVNAATPATYAAVHFLPPETFGTVLENVAGLADAQRGYPRVTATVTFVLCAKNYREIPDMIRLCHERGITRAGFYPLYVCRGRQDRVREYLLTAVERSELDRLAGEGLCAAQRYGITTNLITLSHVLRQKSTGTFFPRLKNGFIVQIHANGLVIPYDFPFIAGDLCRERLCSIWYGARYVRFRNRIKQAVWRHEALASRIFCRRCGDDVGKEQCVIHSGQEYAV